MNTQSKNLERALALLLKLRNLETALDILSNYDSKVSAKFSTLYNHNQKELKEVEIPLSPNVIELIRSEIDARIFDIKKELEKI